MGRTPANENGVLHLYMNLPSAEAAELKALVDGSAETQTGSGRNTTRKSVQSFNPEPLKTPSQLGAVITSGDSEGVTRGVLNRREALDTARATGGDVEGAKRALRRQQNVAQNKPALD